MNSGWFECSVKEAFRTAAFQAAAGVPWAEASEEREGYLKW